MRKLTTILFLFLTLVINAQDEYFRVVDWKFYPINIQVVAQDTYKFDAEPFDFNDPSAIERTVGNYVVDFVGRRYKVIDSTSTTLTVFDEYSTGKAPQSNQIARCYRSVGGGDAKYVGSVDYSTLDLSARWKINGADNELLWRELFNPHDSIQFNPLVSPIPSTPYTMYADTTDRTLSVGLGNGVVMQINQETLIEVYNSTGSTILNGKVCYGRGIEQETPSIALANKRGRYAALLMTTEDIPNNSKGLGVSLVGKVRGVNTGSLTLGPIYVDENGDLTNTTPQFPYYPYLVGVVLKTGTDGIIQFKSDGVNYYNSIRNIMDGSIRETFDFRTFSDGVNTYGVLSNPTGDTTLTLVFSTGWYDFIVPDTIALIDGAIDAPQLNYVYIDETTKTLQVSSGSFPTNEHAKISKAALLTSAQTLSDGALRNQNINDHFKTDNNNGHILHMAERIRVMNAEWESGIAPTLVGTPTNMYFQANAGKVWQMHLQNFPAQDMSTGDDVHIVNDPTSAYRATTNANDITSFSDGSPWNNEWANLMLWGVCNKSGEISHIMLNLPSDGYQQEESAYADALNFTNYTIPREFRGVGFLIGRFTVKRSGGNWSYNSATGFLDLRGFVPNTTAGGGAGGGAAITEWTQLNDIPNSYIGFGGSFATIAQAETGVEFTPKANILLTEFDTTGTRWTQSQVIGLEDSIASLRSGISSSGDVYKTGIPANNQIAIWVNDSTIEGDNKLRFSSGILTVDGDVRANYLETNGFLGLDQIGSDPVGTTDKGYMYYKNDELLFKDENNISYNLLEGSGGTVTNVSSLTTNQLTVANGSTTPQLSIITGAVIPAGTALATGGQIYDFAKDSTLQLGETSTTAYRGDRGKIAYDYSQVGHLPLVGGTLTGELNGTTINLSGDIDLSGGSIYTSGVQINSGYNLDLDGVDLRLNYAGYQGGFTRFRDIIMSDGKGNDVLQLVGSTKNATFSGSVTASSFTATTGATINEFSTDATFVGNSDTAVPTEKAAKEYSDRPYTVQSLSGTSITMNSNLGWRGSLSLTGNTTLTITNLPDGAEGSIEITNGATAYTLNINGSTGYTTEQVMGQNGTIDPTVSSHTTVTFWRTGSTLYYGFIYDN